MLHQLDRIPDVAGRRVAVIGQGSIGLLFSHALKARGAAWVTGVDRVDRSDVAAAFGVDEVVWDDAAAWARGLPRTRPTSSSRPSATTPARSRPRSTRSPPNGTVLAFGVPDETHYAFPFMAFFRKHATLIAGAATDRAQALANARDYLREHRALLAPYITTVVAVRATRRTAFEIASAPAAGRLKVVLQV